MMDSEQQNNDEMAILQLARQLTDLMIAGNTAGIDHIVAPDFTLTHITGYVQSKTEWLNEINTGGMKYHAYQEVSAAIELQEDKAVFTGQNLLDARIWGSRNTWRLQQSMQLEKINGKWIIMNTVATTF